MRYHPKTHAVIFRSIAGTLQLSHYCPAHEANFWQHDGYIVVTREIWQLVEKDRK